MCALLAAIPDPSRAGGWTPATGISPLGMYIDEPEVAVGPEGTAVAVWVHLANSETGEYLIESSARSPGGAWSAPVVVSNPASPASTPRVAMDAAGNAVAVWRAGMGMANVTQTATKPRGGAWTAPQTISFDFNAYSPEIAVDPAGTAIAVWQSDQGAYQPIQATVRPPGGSWSQPEDISPGLKEAYEAEVAFDAAGNAVATWYAYNLAKEAIVEAARRPAGGAWGDPYELSDAGEDANRPAAAAWPGGAIVVWERDPLIQASIGTPGPPWQAPPAELSGAGEDGVIGPRVGSDALGNAVAIWSGKPKPEDQEIRVADRPAGGSFGAPHTISTSGADAYSPDISVNAGGAVAATWLQTAGTFPRVQASVATVGGTWPAPTPLSAPDLLPEYPGVEIDGGGNALVIWRAASKAGQAIETAVYDATGPELREVAIPKRGRAGKPIAFAALPFDAWSAVGPVSWSFGDKTTPATGPSVKHFFRKHGKFRVTVSVADAVGNVASSTATVNVGRALARSKKSVLVKRGKALLELKCPGKAACAGQAKLTVPGKGKRRPKRATTLGKAKFRIRAGKKKTVAIRLKPKALELLRGKSKLRARLSGNAVQRRTVVLKPSRR